MLSKKRGHKLLHLNLHLNLETPVSCARKYFDHVDKISGNYRRVFISLIPRGNTRGPAEMRVGSAVLIRGNIAHFSVFHQGAFFRG